MVSTRSSTKDIKNGGFYRNLRLFYKLSWNLGYYTKIKRIFSKLKEGIIVWFIGLKYDESGNQNDIVSKISECFSEISLSYEEAEIDRMHRISKLNET